MASKKKYDRAAIAKIICDRIAEGEVLTQICKEASMPSAGAFCLWTVEDAAIAEHYARARESRADIRADRIDTYVKQMIAGEIDPQQCRVAIDAEKWQAGKEKPKRYGDKVEIEHSGTIKYSDLTDEQLDEKLEKLERTREPYDG